MHDVEAAQVAFNVENGGDSADVVASGDEGKVSGLVLEPFDDGVLLEIELEGISDADVGVGEPDGPAIVGDNVWDFVGSDGFALDLQEFDLGLSVLNFGEGEPALDIEEESVVLVGLDDGEDVHHADGELNILSDFIINFDSGLLILDDEVGFPAGEGDLEVVPDWKDAYLRRMARGRHSLSLWGPWLGLVALMPPILDRSQDLGVLILFKCFLGPLAMNIYQTIFY